MVENIVMSVLIGGLVGVIGHVRRMGKIIIPRRTKQFIYLGFLEDLLIGSTTAVILVISSGTDSFLRVIFLSMLAGIGGDVFLKGIDLLRSDSNASNATSSKKE